MTPAPNPGRVGSDRYRWLCCWRPWKRYKSLEKPNRATAGAGWPAGCDTRMRPRIHYLPAPSGSRREWGRGTARFATCSPTARSASTVARSSAPGRCGSWRAERTTYRCSFAISPSAVAGFVRRSAKVAVGRKVFGNRLFSLFLATRICYDTNTCSPHSIRPAAL